MENVFAGWEAIVPHLAVLPEAERTVYLELLADALSACYPSADDNPLPGADAGERPTRTTPRGKCPCPKVNPDVTC